jgi:hypothetical protein
MYLKFKISKFIQKKTQHSQHKFDSSHVYMDTITYTSNSVTHQAVYYMTPACLGTFRRTPRSVLVDYT